MLSLFLLPLLRLPPAAWEVELRELVNPSLTKISDSPSSGRDQTCAPDGCIGVLTRVSASIPLRVILTGKLFSQLFDTTSFAQFFNQIFFPDFFCSKHWNVNELDIFVFFGEFQYWGYRGP